MIISHTHRFIFVHCRKVAGSSMKVALAPHLSKDDVVVGSLNEIIEAGVPLSPGMRRILRRPKTRAMSYGAWMMGKSLPEAQNIAVKKYFERGLGANPPHPTAERAARYAGDDWLDYRKFCFVRNPYERVASDYHWRQRSTGKAFSFIDFLMTLREGDDSTRVVHPGAVSNWQMMAIGDDFQMNLVGRYEKLDTDFARITAELGLPALRLGTKQKASGESVDYGALYGKLERTLVTDLFQTELERFGYDFPY